MESKRGAQPHDLVQVARLYYEENLSQEEIARRIGKSRPTVSRLLTAAREQGIVRIDIRVPMERIEPLERAMVQRLRLKECRVVSAPTGASIGVDHLGPAAAEVLHDILGDGMTVGVSNGRSVAATARYLQPDRALHLEVVQIIGATAGEDQSIDTPDIARAMAKAYNAHCTYLHVPLVVDDVQTRELLMRDRSLLRTLRMAAGSNVVLVGIGTLDARDRGPLLEGLLSDKEISAIRSAGAVGHICGEHYDIHGRRIDMDVNDRVVGIGLAALRRIPRVVAVAGGVVKAPAILAAARGGYFDTLVTDDRAALRVLQLVHGAPVVRD